MNVPEFIPWGDWAKKADRFLGESGRLGEAARIHSSDFTSSDINRQEDIGEQQSEFIALRSTGGAETS